MFLMDMFCMLQGESNLTFSQCSRYAVNWTALLQTHTFMEITPNNSWPTESCWAGWEYNTTQDRSSIVVDVSTQTFSHVALRGTVALWYVYFKITYSTCNITDS